MTAIAYLALGSNVRPEHHLQQGIAALVVVGDVLAVSAVYQTPAIGAPDQPDYLNAVCQLRTALSAVQLRPLLKAIEDRAGRRPGHQPIPLDLDLCLLGTQQIATETIQLPHPDLLTRSAIAQGMADLDPAARHPVTGERFIEIAARLGQALRPKPRPDVRLTVG